MNQSQGEEQARNTADMVARRSYGKLVAFLAARTKDVAAAEDALSDAFASALADWPVNGCPENPEAWLLTVARRKQIDLIRRRQSGEAAAEQLQVMAEGLGDIPFGAATEEIPDRRLALMFACAHPAIEIGVRAPLILQVVLGLDAAAIASAFLISPKTMGQRLVRAKNKIKDAGIPFRIPEREELRDRLETVLDAIYAAFAEGWIDASGTDLARRDLSVEAIYLGRLIVELLPQEPEALGLLALMLHAEARRHARRSAHGDYVPFADQDPSLWDLDLIREAEALLFRASTLGSIGRYQLEGAVQSAHVTRRLLVCENLVCENQVGENSDRDAWRANWEDVLHLYDALLSLSHSPVVAINRALVIAELHGAEAALDAMPIVAADPRLAEYQPYWAARAELLSRAKTGNNAEARKAEARKAYEIAIGLERDDSVRSFLRAKQSALLP
ncbi:MAG TPA: DUF6596 domain-containing protein [Candidatus Angelobacter sp.]|nr:DUF6596 domain-containing protein [Candidatus Angelobacter sp.]